MSENQVLQTKAEFNSTTNYPKITYEHALTYAGELGWFIIPLHYPVKDGACSCGNPKCKSIGKHPLTANGLTGASNDTSVIRSWFKEWRFCNIGIVTGEISGICVLDADKNKGKRSLLSQPPIPYTTTSKSGNGYHYILKHPGKKVKTTTDVLPGLDSRGDGGYIVAPPSLHYSGYRYEWVDKGVIAPAPDWWLDLIENPVVVGPKDVVEYSVTIPQKEIGSMTSYAVSALQKELSVLYSIGEGSRNRQLNRSAFNLGQLVSAGVLDETTVYNALYDAGIGIGLEDHEIKITVKSGLKGGHKKHRSNLQIARP